MNLPAAIMHLRPDARPRIDYRVTDDGQGPYLSHWDEAGLGPRPADEELAAASLEAEKLTRCAAIDAATSAAIAAGVPYDGKMISMDPVSQSNWTNLYLAGASGLLAFPVEITTDDNSPYEIADLAALTAFYGTLIGAAKAILDRARDAKSAILAATQA